MLEFKVEVRYDTCDGSDYSVIIDKNNEQVELNDLVQIYGAKAVTIRVNNGNHSHN